MLECHVLMSNIFPKNKNFKCQSDPHFAPPCNCVTASLRHHITASLHHHITVSLHHCVTTSPHYCITVFPCHCITTLPHHCITTSQHYHITTSLCYCVTASPHYCVTAWLHQILKLSILPLWILIHQFQYNQIKILLYILSNLCASSLVVHSS